MSRALLPAALIAFAGLAACGGDDVASPTSSTASATSATAVAGSSAPVSPTAASSPQATTPATDTSADAPATAQPSTAVTPPVATSAAAPDVAGLDDDFDICASVPPLDVINGQLTEPATQLVELERGPGFAICEANGGEVDNVQFQRITDVTRERSIELATELGATVTDLSDPAGGFAYAGAAAVVIDGVEWTVQAITWDTIGDPDSPAAIERSGTLLRAWLAQMGVTA